MADHKSEDDLVDGRTGVWHGVRKLCYDENNVGARGITYTGFFGGLTNSTAIVSELSSRMREHPDLMLFAASAVVLSNVAMCAKSLTMYMYDIFRRIGYNHSASLAQHGPHRNALCIHYEEGHP